MLVLLGLALIVSSLFGFLWASFNFCCGKPGLPIYFNRFSTAWKHSSSKIFFLLFWFLCGLCEAECGALRGDLPLERSIAEWELYKLKNLCYIAKGLGVFALCLALRAKRRIAVKRRSWTNGNRVCHAPRTKWELMLLKKVHFWVQTYFHFRKACPFGNAAPRKGGARGRL